MCFSFLQSVSQIAVPQKPVDENFFTKVDSLYREDQFYFGLTYNVLTSLPTGMKQNGFSSGVSVGFLRDMPLNKNRTFAIAIGAGLSYANYQQNLVTSENSGVLKFELVRESDLSKGKLEQVFIDVPFELRWRTSTPTSYKFWRVYTGVKFQYLLYDRSRFQGDGFDFTVTNNANLNHFQYGPYLAFGFNTWNFQAYYGVNSLFKDVVINNESVEAKTINIGLMFYIL